MKKPTWKYINPDKRCQYPPVVGRVDYCWGYAGAVDKNKEKEFIEKVCPTCDLWVETKSGEKLR